MAYVTDNFNRSSLGQNWTQINQNLQSDSVGVGGIAVAPSAYSPVDAHGSDANAVWAQEGFANDQYASAVVSAIAPMRSVIHITAVSFSGGNVTVTYTLTSGQALISGQEVICTGLQNAGNNAQLFVATLGAGTFTAPNASGVTESGSNGTGNSPSDCGCGVLLRATFDGKNGYFFHAGMNSYDWTSAGGGHVAGTKRVYYREIWKIVNGVSTYLTGVGNLTSVPDVPGDFYAMWVLGNKIHVSKNGVELTGWDASYPVVDSSLASGTPGIWTWSFSGPHEYDWGNWGNSGVVGSDPPGNSGTKWGTWAAGDAIANYAAIGSDALTEYGFITDAIAYSNGDLHTKNANWVYEGSSAFTVSSNKVFYSTVAQNPGLAYRSDASPGADQWAQCTMVIGGIAGTQNCGPAVRISTSQQTGYYVQAASDTLALAKVVNGSATPLGSSSTHPTNGSSILLTALGSTISVFLNGVKLIEVTDTAIASGQAGIYGAGNALVNGFSAMFCGTLVSVANGSPLSLIGFSRWAYSASGAQPLNNTTAGQTVTALYDGTNSYGSDHYAQGIITSASVPATETGPAVRVDGVADKGYLFCNLAGVAYIKRFNGATMTTLSSGTHAYVQNETYRLEVQGNLLVGKINGTVVVMAVDNTYATGVPGIANYTKNTLGGGVVSTWAAGNVTVIPNYPTPAAIFVPPAQGNFLSLKSKYSINFTQQANQNPLPAPWVSDTVNPLPQILSGFCIGDGDGIVGAAILGIDLPVRQYASVVGSVGSPTDSDLIVGIFVDPNFLYGYYLTLQEFSDGSYAIIFDGFSPQFPSGVVYYTVDPWNGWVNGSTLTVAYDGTTAYAIMTTNGVDTLLFAQKDSLVPQGGGVRGWMEIYQATHTPGTGATYFEAGEVLLKTGGGGGIPPGALFAGIGGILSSGRR